VIAISRFRVVAAESAEFIERAHAAIEVLAAARGFRSVDFGRNLDEPELWTITTRWDDVGSYRRALQGFAAKSVVVPLLSVAIDEPSAYDEPELVGENLARGSLAGPLS
jgi:hypothetical protein